MLSRFCKLCNVLLFICYASSLSLLSSQNPCFLAQLYSELGGRSGVDTYTWESCDHCRTLVYKETLIIMFYVTFSGSNGHLCFDINNYEETSTV